MNGFRQMKIVLREGVQRFVPTGESVENLVPVVRMVAGCG